MKRVVCLAMLLLPSLTLAASITEKQDSTISAENATIQQPDFIFEACKETRSLGNSNAELGVSPGGMLGLYLNDHGHSVDYHAIKNVLLLQDTKHGKLVAHATSAGMPYYMYDPVAGYEGDDNAVFMIEFEGKRYQVLMTLKVYAVKALPQDIETCPSNKLIKMTKPSKRLSR